MEGANKPPRAYVPSQPAVKSSQPQIKIGAAKNALTSDFGCKDSNFSKEMQVFRKKIIPLRRF